MPEACAFRLGIVSIKTSCEKTNESIFRWYAS